VLARLARQRQRLFEQVGALDESDFRRRVAEYAQAAELRTSRDALQREIAAALGTQYTEEELRLKIASLPPAKLEAQWQEISDRLAELESLLKQHFEQRGQLNLQIEQLAADRRLPERQLELNLVRQRLKEAIHRWQVRAATSTILESVRSHYEHERQPQTLRDASELLHALTGGRWRRVWTPMDEDRLLVDDADGPPLTVENLSRGTREQLFLSLRLALVRDYARRGVRLPVVLDDVLVNFDSDRAKAAAGLLADFAAEGHQVLVFTCHEHIAKLMRCVKAPVMELPHRELRVDQPESKPVKRPRSRRKPAVKRQPVLAVQPVAPAIEEPVAEPVLQSPILIAEPLPDLPRAKPLVEELPPLPINGSEADFAELDSLPTIDRAPPLAPLWSLRTEGAEEFSGEFATRPSYED
jgi:hypothetical protein